MSEQRAHDPLPEIAPPPEPRRTDSALDRLTVLHAEATEISALANLSRRVPWFAGLYGIAGIATAAVAAAGTPASVTWALFALIGAAMLVRLDFRLWRSSLELRRLRRFEVDLAAALLYCGTVWGCGAFLIDHNLLILLVFSVGMTAAAEVLLLRPRIALCFAVPANLLAAAMAIFGEAGLAASGMILGAGVAVLASAELVKRLIFREVRPPAVTVS